VIVFSGYVHMAINVSIYVFLIKNIDDMWLSFTVLFFILLGSLFPDVDCPSSIFGKWFILINYSEDPMVNKYNHRRFPHTIIGMLIFGLPIAIFSWKYSLIFMACYISHLICDSTTKKGVKFLYPLSKKSYGIKKVGSGEDLILLLILVPYIFSVFDKIK